MILMQKRLLQQSQRTILSYAVGETNQFLVLNSGTLNIKIKLI
jgi:hypothetical protein